MKIDYNKHIWEGWTVQDFIDELNPTIKIIMKGNAITRPFTTKDELKKYCISNQPYYKKYIPEVVEHFANKLNLKS